MWLCPKIIAFISVTFYVTHAIVVRQENSLYGPFEAGAPNVAHWDLVGSAQWAQTFIRLTPDEPGKQGSIWNTYPVLPNDWELHMQFHIHGRHVKEGSGNGLAIWYTKDILTGGPVFGSMDNFSGLGIFIDTSLDPLRPHKHRHPYISAMVNNGSQAYEHNEDGTIHQIGGCHIPIRNLDWPTKIAVSYINNIVTVFVDAEGREQWIQCFRAEGVYLPTHYFFGISASSGDIKSDNHDIVYITALDMNQPEKMWEDRSYIVPFATNVLVHPRQEEVKKTAEQLQHVEEKQTQTEPKRETKRDIKEETKKETTTQKHKTTEAEKAKLKAEKPPPTHRANMVVKGIYVIGICVILYIAYALFKAYRTQRRERLQKRLF